MNQQQQNKISIDPYIQQELGKLNYQILILNVQLENAAKQNQELHESNKELQEKVQELESKLIKTKEAEPKKK